MLLFLLLGGYLIYLALPRGLVLRVTTFTGERMFPFSPTSCPEELSAFIAAARDRFGYTVENSSPIVGMP